MKLKEIKNWIESLPEELLEYDVFNAEEGPISDTELSYRLDLPIVTLTVDEERKEILFMNDKPDIDKLEMES